MEAQTDIQTYLEQGKMALAQGQGREAAIAYAHGAQLEADNPMVHLGLAEANLALGNYGVVQMACRRVQELQPQGGIEATMAQALRDLLDRRYDRALQQVDSAISQDPGVAYAHALRSFLLRTLGQDYDANLARARAARLSYGGRFEKCFPSVEPSKSYTSGYNGNTSGSHPSVERESVSMPRPEREQIPAWSQPNRMQRQMIRTRFVLSQFPALVTYALIIINALVFLAGAVFPGIYGFGVQVNALVLQGQYWRILTAMFLHDGILHIGLNMLSLYFIGPAVEITYGKVRYLAIYLISGIMGGVLSLLISLFGDPAQAVVPILGASGAIFGIFGALGAFYLLNRKELGINGRGAIGNWLFWLGINLLIGFMPGSNIAVWAHVGGLVAGVILAIVLLPRQRFFRR